MFFGSIPALVTPFKNGEVDAEAFSRFVDWQIEQGSNGLVPCGTTGEVATLSGEEQRQVIGLAVEAAKGRVPVIAGCGGYNTAAVIEATKAAADLGATAALTIVPYYNKPSQAGLVAHFLAIAEETPIPMMIYNVPSRTVADIGVAAGNGKGEIIRKGERIATVQEADIVEALVHFAKELQDEIRAERGEGKPEVLGV